MYRFCCWVLWVTVSLGVSAQKLSEGAAQKPGFRKPAFYDKARAKMKRDFTPEYFNFLVQYKFDNEQLNTHILQYLEHTKKERKKYVAAMFVGAGTLLSALFLFTSGLNVIDAQYKALGSTMVAVGSLGILGSPVVVVPFHIGARRERKKAFYSAMEIARMRP